MTELLFDDPCILFALRRESQAFRREFLPQQRFPKAPCRAQFCGPAWLSVLVAETGIGSGRMTAALDWLLNSPVLENVPYLPKLVIVAGFSGALREEHKVGDIILANEVVDHEGGRWPVTWPGVLPAGEWRPPLQRGRIVSTPQLVGSPEEKRELGRTHDALAVDMESAVAVRLCHKYGVPFGCVRAISDDLHTPLSPRLTSVVKGGRVAPLRLLAALAAAPRLGGEIWRLAKQTRTAAEQLAKALGELLTLTLPWMADA